MDADLLAKAGVVVAVLAVVWVLADLERYHRRVLRVLRALHLAAPPTPPPAGPPIERIAADVQRIRAQVRHPPPGIPVARRRGWLEAYDDVLVTACRALELRQRLTALPLGPERDLERERVERMLVRAGLLQPTSPET